MPAHRRRGAGTDHDRSRPVHAGFQAAALLVGRDAAGRISAEPALPRARRRGGRRLRLYRPERRAADGARRAIDTLVIDAEAAGWGCRTRNGGQVGSQRQAELFGAGRDSMARRALAASSQEGHRSLAWLGEFVARGRDRLRLPRLRPLPRRAQRAAIRGARPSSSPTRRPESTVRPSWCRAPSRRARSAPTPITAASSIRGTPRSTRRAIIAACSSACSPPARRIVPHCAVTDDRAAGAAAFASPPRAARSRRATSIVATNGYSGARHAVAPAARHSDRQLHHRDRADPARDDGPALPDRPHGHRHAQGGLLLSRLARPHAHPLRRPRLLERDRPARKRAAAARRDGAALPGARRRARQPLLDGLCRLHVRPR